MDAASKVLRGDDLSSKHLVDPELLPALTIFAGEPLSAANLPVLRAQIAEIYRAMSVLASGVASDIECREMFARELNGASAVLVELDEGVRIMSNLVGCPPEAARIRAHVQVIFEQRGLVRLPMFILLRPQPP